MVNEEPANFDDHGNLVSEGYKGDLKTFLSHLNEFLVASKQWLWALKILTMI